MNFQYIDTHAHLNLAQFADAPRVAVTETLSNLINRAIDDDRTIVVTRDNADVGVITRADLLRTVIEGTEMS